MKKRILFLIATIVLFVPSVMASEAPNYDETAKIFFANGTPVTIEARNDGVDGALVKWDGGEMLLPADASVFGGSHYSDVKLDSTSVTMNGGTLMNVNGGGLHKSSVGTAVVTINGGTVTTGVRGGGASSFNITTCHRPWYDGDKENAPTLVDKTIVTINGGEINVVYGGGEGISYTKDVTLVVNDGTIEYLTNGGANGFTDKASLEVNGGTIGVMQSVNRGTTESTETVVNGGTIENLYVGGEAANDVTGTINEVTLYVLDGEVTNLYTGYNNGRAATENDDFNVVYNEEVVENVSLDGINGDNINTTVTLTFTNGNNSESVIIPKGTTLTEEELQELFDEINSALKEDNLKLVGFYKDSELSTEFDFTTPINEDTEVFMKVEEIKTEEVVKKEDNPNTSDINLALVLGMITACSAGVVISYKKRNVKVNS